MTDEAQARSVEALIERALPGVFFLDPQFFEVISREDALLAGGEHTPPHADGEFLAAFCQLRPRTPASFTAHDLFTTAQDQRLVGSFRNLADTIVDRVEALRDHLDNDADFQRELRRLANAAPIQRGTRDILRELIRAMVTDRNTPINRNQAIDLLHAVVPIAYCDFVLLDGHWRAQVDQVRQRFANAGASVPIARVFSRRDDGVNRFLQELESV